MSDIPQDVCICAKPCCPSLFRVQSSPRSNPPRPVSYCSPECQKRDWKTHKVQCNAATGSAPAQVGSSSQLNQLLRIGAKYSIYDESMALGLDPTLISGASGADFYDEKDGAGQFWQLEAPAREQWEAKADVHNRKSQRFWTTYLDPISTDRKWIDSCARRCPPRATPQQRQHDVNANILAGLFPHLRKFTPAQNTALLDLFTSRVWSAGGTFRLETGAGILFAHGRPSADLIDQLVGRCLSWTRPYSELSKLLEFVALPIQKHWADIAGTRILDLALAMLSPGRPGPPGGRTVPGDKILQIAETSPVACKHLLPVVMSMCRARMIGDPASKLLDLLEAFGVAIRGPRTD
ncbi:hypothetical protein FB451DRAFT_1286330, partial [Mycena latifolia]